MNDPRPNNGRPGDEPSSAAQAAARRRRAEDRLPDQSVPDGGPLSLDEASRLIHELRVHQIELEMQNEELRQARDGLEESAGRYADLYDFAPVSYVTLAVDGRILGANLTGATYLAVERGKLVGRHFGRFLTPSSRPAFATFLGAVFAGEATANCEVSLSLADSPERRARLEGTVMSGAADGAAVCRLVIIDISEHTRETAEIAELLRVAETTRHALQKTLEDERRTEAALAESEAILQSFFHSPGAMRGIVELVDGDIRHLTDNAVTAGFFGMKAEAMRGRRAGELGVPRTIIDLWTAHYEASRRTQKPVQFEYEHEAGWLFASVSCLPGAPGTEARFTYEARDITARKKAEAARKKAEAERNRLQDVLHRSLNEIYLFDPDSLRFKYVNTGALKNLGHPLETMRGLTPVDIKPDYTRPEFERLLAPLRTGVSEVLCFETCHRRADDSRYPVEVHLQLIRQPEGDVFLAVILDITERKRTGHALQSSEHRLRLATEAARLGVWDRDVVGNQLVWDERMYELYGVPAGACGGVAEAWEKAVHPDDFARVSQEGRDALAGRKDFHTQFRVVWPDGQIRFMEAHAIVLRGPDGAAQRMIGINRDITERIQAEKTSAEQAQQVRDLLESTAEAIYGLDLEGRCTFANPACVEMLGYGAADELIGRNMHGLIHHHRSDGSAYPADECPIYQAFRGGHGTHIVDEVFWRADGSSFPAEYWSHPIRRDGEICGSVVAFLDITERKQAQQEIERSRRFLDSLINASPIIVFVKDREGRHLLINDQYEKVVGKTREQVIGRTDDDLFPPEAARKIREQDQAIIKDGKAFEFQEQVPMPDGPHDYLTNKVPLRNADGEIFALCGWAVDITLREQALQSLRESEALYQSLVEQLPQCIYNKDRQGRFLYVNERFCRLTGVAITDVLGRTDFDLFPRAAAEKYAEDDRRVLEDGLTLHLEEETPTMAGVRFVEIVKSPLRDERGEIVGSQGIFWDVTDQRAARARVRELSSAVEQTADAVFMTDRAGEFTFVNPAFEELTGFRFAELDGKTPRVLKSGEMGKEFYHGLWRTLVSGAVFRGTIINRKKSGELIHCDVTITPLLGEDGDVTHFVSTFKDVTERIRAELELSALHESLWQAQERERRRIARELHDSTAQDLVAAMMTLDLFREEFEPRNPVAGRKLADTQALLEKAVNEIRTLSYLLHPPRLDEAGLAGAIRHYAAGFGERTGLGLTLELPADFERLEERYELMLFRVAQEALGNIHRHSQSETTGIRLVREERQVILEISDTGRGIAAGILERQSEAGVGIRSMRERLRQMGGRLEIDTDGSGTTVRAILPLGENEEKLQLRVGR